MINHIVMWKFKENTDKEQQEFLDGLLRLQGIIPEILDMEVAYSIGDDKEYDAILVSKFASMEDLHSYKENKEHVKVSNLCKNIRESRVAFDYER